ncbi:MAG TPA: site-specific integrase [Acidimicrobiia bacterium]|nr:site-specific integrase [Acidimicrobiia bacterium]
MRRTHNVLHRALVQAVRWGWIGVDPAAAATPPRLPTRDIRPPTPEQVRLLFARAAEENPAFAVFLQLAAATGARRGELIALRWTDVNLAAGTVTIARGAVKGTAWSSRTPRRTAPGASLSTRRPSPPSRPTGSRPKPLPASVGLPCRLTPMSSPTTRTVGRAGVRGS